ncbi:MAG: hypothetical protein CMH56_10835 [Myxococcales bacterium]|nr:hypothetical protein [Myxococcales bacterium]|tara:strand:+ start:1138 stop:2289 length:1152 start_codon:yes stop_codon:yes gene_type:complete
MAMFAPKCHNPFMKWSPYLLLLIFALGACPTPVEEEDIPWPPPEWEYTPLPSEGEQLYVQYCAFCHGDEGEGYIADNANALANTQFLEVATDEFIKDGIRYGRPGTPMSAWGVDYGGPLVDDHIDTIVEYIRTLNPNVPAQEVHELEITGDAEAGAEVFATHCAACHGADGSGNTAMSLNNPFFLNQASDGFIQYSILHGRPGTVMPAYEGALFEHEIDNLVALIRSWDDDQEPEPLPAFNPDLSDNLINEGGESADFSADLIEDRFVPAAAVNSATENGESLVILDARPHSDYLAGHISGAIALPFYLIETNIDLLPKDKWIITYCGCPHAISGQALDKLKENGFDKVAVLNEGFYYWERFPYPVSRGRDRYESAAEEDSSE